MAKDLGVVIPAIRVQDNVQLDDDEYAIFIKEHRVAAGRLRGGQFLVLNPSDRAPEFPAERTSDPTFGIPALWIEPSYRMAAEAAGLSVVEPLTVLVTHLSETVRRHLDSLISFAATQKLIDRIGEDHHKLVQTVIPASISIAGVQSVLRGLLRENVSIRNLPEIIEAAAEFAPRARDFDDLVEHVRRRLRRGICLQLSERSGGRLHAVVYVPRAADSADDSSPRSLSGGEAARLLDGLASAEKKHGAASGLVLIVPDALRPFIAEIVRRQGRGTAVLAQGEIDDAIEVVVEGRI
jgi:flagellar biosynthesis protein FlhA